MKSHQTRSGDQTLYSNKMQLRRGNLDDDKRIEYLPIWKWDVYRVSLGTVLTSADEDKEEAGGDLMVMTDTFDDIFRANTPILVTFCGLTKNKSRRLTLY